MIKILLTLLESNNFTGIIHGQGFEGRKSKAVIEKYGGTGTGVFIPRSLHIVGGKKLPEELSGGTGVFLNHQVAITCQQRKKTSKSNSNFCIPNNYI